MSEMTESLETRMGNKQLTAIDEDELRSLIREILTEHDRTSPLNRETIRFWAWVMGAVLVTGLALLGVWMKLEVLPEVDRRIVAHEIAARERMSDEAEKYATTLDLEALRTNLEQSRTERIERDKSIMEILLRIEDRLSRIEARR